MEEEKNPQEAQPGQHPGVGAVLREAREQMGLSVEEVATRLKFAPRQIVALEEENFGQLPEMIFVRGFVRSYARFLEMDPEPLLEALPGAPVQGPPSTARSSKNDVLPGSGIAGKQNLLWLAAALGVAVIIAVLAWKYSAEGTRARVATVPRHATLPGTASGVQQIVSTAASAVLSEFSVPGAHPANAVGASAVTAASGVDSSLQLRPAQQVKVVFTEDSWVEIKDASGKVVLSTLGKKGVSQSVTGSPPLSVIVGNANGVKLYYKNAPIDLGQHPEHEVVRLKLE